jgi:hypothetical protein
MVETISWIIAALIGLGAVVGFTGVVATSVLTVVRRVRRPRIELERPEHRAPVEPSVEARRYTNA